MSKGFSDREVNLLMNAVRCLREQRSPFSHSELVKFEVTLDECFDLSRLLASCVEMCLAHSHLQDLVIKGDFQKLVLEDFAREEAKQG